MQVDTKRKEEEHQNASSMKGLNANEWAGNQIFLNGDGQNLPVIV